ncbi:hypothetical protein P8452_47291 [Trifolium repens]|nr:hypothetical protein P8452_47291 [Trifolium repens]
MCRTIFHFSKSVLLQTKTKNMARNFEFIKDITDRKYLFKIAVMVKDKWNILKEGKKHFEMVVVDSKILIHYKLQSVCIYKDGK